jgi:hypothetical protein
MPIVDPSMSPEQMRHVALALVQLAFFSGLLGAMAWSVGAWLLNGLADAITAWEDKRARIYAARARASKPATQAGAADVRCSYCFKSHSGSSALCPECSDFDKWN